MNDSFPDPRRYAVDIGAAGAQTVRFGDTHPNLCGWVLSWTVRLGTHSALPECKFTCADRWYEQRELVFGSDDLSPSMTQGGRVYIPYPSIVCDFFDPAGVGAVEVQIIGRPIMYGQLPGAHTTLIGFDKTNVDAEGQQGIEIPIGAYRYWTSLTGQSSGVRVELQSGNAFAVTYDQYSLVQGNVTNNMLAPSPWRNLPPLDASTNGRVLVSNQDGANAASMATYFEFDFASGR